jgi:PEP-CTERM motif
MSPLRFPAALSLAAALLAALPAGAATVSCTSNVTDCANALNGHTPDEYAHWSQQTAYWTGLSDSVTVDFGAATFVGGLTISLDNNDSYLVESSLDGSHWSTMLTVNDNQGDVWYGMDTFSTLVGHAQYDATLAFSAGSARYLRVSAFGGDSLNSVGEIGVAVSAVPEPASAALMLGGLALLGGAARRRRAR